MIHLITDFPYERRVFGKRGLRFCFVIATLFAALVFTTPILAASTCSANCASDESYASLASIPKPLRLKLDYTARYEEYYVARTLSVIREGGRSKQWIDQADVDAMSQKFVDGQRHVQFQKLLAMDGNFDGQVTAQEVETFYHNTSGQNAVDADAEAATVMRRYDTDHNGVLSLEEMAHFRSDDAVQSPVAWWGTMSEWLDLDPNNDGKLTLQELSCLAHKAFRTIDTNRDGFISTDEADALRKADTGAATP